MTMDVPGIRTDTQTFSGAAGTPPAGGLAPADRTSTVTGGAGVGADGPVPAGDEKPDWAVGDVIDA